MFKNIIVTSLIVVFMMVPNIMTVQNNNMQSDSRNELVEKIIGLLSIDEEIGYKLPRENIINYEYIIFDLNKTTILGVAFYNEDEDKNPIRDNTASIIKGLEGSSQEYEKDPIKLGFVGKYNLDFERFTTYGIKYIYSHGYEKTKEAYAVGEEIYGYEKDTNRRVLIMYAYFPREVLGIKPKIVD